MGRIAWAAIAVGVWVASLEAGPPVLQPRPGGAKVPARVLESRDLTIKHNPWVNTDDWPVVKLKNVRRIMRDASRKVDPRPPLRIMWDEPDHCFVSPDGKKVVVRAFPLPNERSRSKVPFCWAIIDVETGKVITPSFTAKSVPILHAGWITRVYPRLSVGREGKAFLTVRAFDLNGNGDVDSTEFVGGVRRLSQRLAEMDFSGKVLSTRGLGLVHWAAYGHDGKTIYALREEFRQEPGDTPRDLVAWSGKEVRKIRQLDRTKRRLGEVSPAESVCLVLDWKAPREPAGWGALWLMNLKDGKRLWRIPVGSYSGLPRDPIVWTRDGKYACYEGKCLYVSGQRAKGHPVKSRTKLTYMRNRADGSLAAEVYVGRPVGRGPGASQIVCERMRLYDVRTGQGWRIGAEPIPVTRTIYWAGGGKVIFGKLVKRGGKNTMDIYVADLPDPSKERAYASEKGPTPEDASSPAHGSQGQLSGDP